MNNEEFLNQIKSKCPKLYSHLIYIESGSGWNLLLEKLSITIENEIERIAKTDPIAAEQLYVVQIKEKFGGLRFYMSHSTPFIEGAIHLAEYLSFRICEDCGGNAPGTKSIGGWIVTRCDPCYEQAKKGREF
jgi:hypothetical protein